jgi:methyl-accepting chemotaxis protein
MINKFEEIKKKIKEIQESLQNNNQEIDESLEDSKKQGDNLSENNKAITEISANLEEITRTLEEYKNRVSSDAYGDINSKDKEKLGQE